MNKIILVLFLLTTRVFAWVDSASFSAAVTNALHNENILFSEAFAIQLQNQISAPITTATQHEAMLIASCRYFLMHNTTQNESDLRNGYGLRQI